jgi:lysyl-tRNA synthetase class 2
VSDARGDTRTTPGSGDPKRRRAVETRQAVMRAVRGFFETLGFVEVETPLMVPAPGLEPNLEAFEVKGAGAPRYLAASPEFQMKRLLVEGYERIFQVCKCFRREEEGALHQAEFTMLEWYRVGAGSAGVIADTERLVAHVARSLGDGSTVIPARSAPVDVTPPWEVLTVSEAFRRYADADAAALAGDEDRFFRTLVERIEPELGRGRPTFLTRYPASMASLARLEPGDPGVADRFEAYLDGVELCNGFGELTDAAEQRRRFETVQRTRAREGKPVYPIDERFLQALERGMPESGGNALGLDRLVMLLTGATSIDEVVALPPSAL